MKDPARRARGRSRHALSRPSTFQAHYTLTRTCSPDGHAALAVKRLVVYRTREGSAIQNEGHIPGVRHAGNTLNRCVIQCSLLNMKGVLCKNITNALTASMSILPPLEDASHPGIALVPT